MGVGTPEDLWEAVEMGIDQFDCVLPTRNGRNGQLFTSAGKLNMKNAPYPGRLQSPRPGMRLRSLRALHAGLSASLLSGGRTLRALRLASLHNVAFLIKLMRKIRQSITDGTFLKEKQKVLGIAYRNQGE